MIRKPETFIWWENMPKIYNGCNGRQDQENNFYRGNKSVEDIRKLAELSQAELKQCLNNWIVAMKVAKHFKLIYE